MRQKHNCRWCCAAVLTLNLSLGKFIDTHQGKEKSREHSKRRATLKKCKHGWWVESSCSMNLRNNLPEPSAFYIFFRGKADLTVQPRPPDTPCLSLQPNIFIRGHWLVRSHSHKQLVPKENHFEASQGCSTNRDAAWRRHAREGFPAQTWKRWVNAQWKREGRTAGGDVTWWDVIVHERITEELIGSLAVIKSD